MSGQAQAPSAPSAPPMSAYEDPVKPSSSQRQGGYGEAPRYPPGQWQSQAAYRQPSVGYPAVYAYAPPTVREIGLCNWASAVLMALLGLVPCCIIPFCCTSCKDRVYRCEHCGAVLGRQQP
ncbi:hypothetical protein WJX81_000433 [Elliptochloris bilobata]|uniref:LITAF domain-containing protein n=1 Tax=Elliptochloris bilobata TaxID=381761 RepID=A0AAW1QVR3_9CHLO